MPCRSDQRETSQHFARLGVPVMMSAALPENLKTEIRISFIYNGRRTTFKLYLQAFKTLSYAFATRMSE